MGKVLRGKTQWAKPVGGGKKVEVKKVKWDGQEMSGIKCPKCETEMVANDTKDLFFCPECNDIYFD